MSPLRVINRNARSEHFSSAILCKSGLSHAGREGSTLPWPAQAGFAPRSAKVPGRVTALWRIANVFVTSLSGASPARERWTSRISGQGIGGSCRRSAESLRLSGCRPRPNTRACGTQRSFSDACCFPKQGFGSAREAVASEPRHLPTLAKILAHPLDPAQSGNTAGNNCKFHVACAPHAAKKAAERTRRLRWGERGGQAIRRFRISGAVASVQPSPRDRRMPAKSVWTKALMPLVVRQSRHIGVAWYWG